MALCKVTLIGNLGGDPEMRYTPTGRAFTSFSVACNRTYTPADGERREETEWSRVTAWGRLGEVCSQYLHKGSKAYIEGRLSSRSWEGADGQKRFSLEVTANDVQILDARGRGDGTDGPTGVGMGMGHDEPNDLDSIPF